MYSIYEFMFNNHFDTVLLIIGLFTSILSSYFGLKEFALLDTNSSFIKKLQSRIDSLIGVFSYTLLFFFGVSILVNSLINTIDYTKIFVGSCIIFLYLYVVYINFIYKQEEVFKLIDINKLDEKLYVITLNNDKIGLIDYYTNSKEGYKKNKVYKCKYNKYNNKITKVINEVYEVK